MDIEKAKQLISQGDAIIITCGAGMGVDSGLPDFRGDEGFWKAYPVIKDLGLSFSQMANPQWFDTNPTLAWAFYGHRLNLYRDTIPHDGFKLLLELVKEKNNNYFIFTSNVDGQFQKAGFNENKIIECHGSIHHLQCKDNCTNKIWENNQEINIDIEKFEALNFPYCPNCSAIARPNILMFGDWDWNSSREQLQEQRYEKFLQENQNSKIIVIEIGAGTAVPTVRYESESITKRFSDTHLIRINPRDYHLNGAKGVSIALGGLEGIKSIL